MACRVCHFQGEETVWNWRFTISVVPDASTDIAAVLLKSPVFSELEGNELSFLAQRAVRRRYSAGEVFCVEGEACTGLYVVESGHVRIFTSSAGGREHVLSIEGPGRSVAVLLLFDDGNYPTSVSAIEDSRLVFVSKQDFQALCLAHPQVALMFRFSWKWRRCSPGKVKERTHEETTEALYAGREGRHPEAASAGE
jgi:CRP-like cAMP-binding protein